MRLSYFPFLPSWSRSFSSLTLWLLPTPPPYQHSSNRIETVSPTAQVKCCWYSITCNSYQLCINLFILLRFICNTMASSYSPPYRHDFNSVGRLHQFHRSNDLGSYLTTPNSYQRYIHSFYRYSNLPML